MHHERTCNRNPDATNIGMGVPRQHFRGEAANVEQRMMQVQSSIQNNFRLYRRVLNSSRNIFDQIQHVVVHDVRGILRRQHQ